jgi:hypothetical protein
LCKKFLDGLLWLASQNPILYGTKFKCYNCIYFGTESVLKTLRKEFVQAGLHAAGRRALVHTRGLDLDDACRVIEPFKTGP